MESKQKENAVPSAGSRMTEPKPPETVDETDTRLAALDEIMQSPLGRAWLEPDLVAEPMYGPPKPFPMPGVVAPLPRRKRIKHSASRTTLPPMVKVVQFEAGALRTLSR